MTFADTARARWIAVAEGVFAPAVVTWGDRHVALIMRGATGEVLYRERDGATWTQMRSLGMPTARADARGGSIPVDWPIRACSTGDGRIHLLARGPEGELVHGILSEGHWSGFDLIGIPSVDSGAVAMPIGLAAAPVACSRDPGRMDVFSVNVAGELLHCGWGEDGFTEFVSLGGIADRDGAPGAPIAGPISACNCGHRKIAVFTRGSAGDLLVKWWEAGTWTAFQSLGAPQQDDVFYPGNPRPVPLSGPPVACGGGSARLDVFARGAGGDLVHRSWDGAAWSEFGSLWMPVSADAPTPVPFTGASLACAWGRYQVDVFAVAADGKLYNWSSNGASL